MKNFEVTSIEDGKKYWISRSVAVSVFLYIKDGEEEYILANKRGEGSADYQGLWNCPCGYLDFDETAEQAGVREVLEETGYILDENDLIFMTLNTDPRENRQNVSIRFDAYKSLEELKRVEMEGGEENEVAEVKLINIKDIDKYEWAFGHKEIIKGIK